MRQRLISAVIINKAMRLSADINIGKTEGEAIEPVAPIAAFAAQAIKADFLRDPQAPDRNAVALRQC
jgi:hypothetical protein